MFFSKKQSGFSTTELMIGLAVTSLVGLGGAYMLSNVEKDKYHLTSRTEYLSLEKSIEGYLISARGCETLKDLPVNAPEQDFQFQMGDENSPVYGVDKTFADITIKGLRVANFVAMDAESSTGIAQIELLMLKKGAENGVRRLIPVAVNVSNNIIQDCNFYRTKAYTELMNKACYTTYGLPDTMTCDQVRNLVLNKVVEEICKDVFNGTPPRLDTNTTIGDGKLHFCNLNFSQVGQDCGAFYAQGVNPDGKLNCVASTVPPAPTCTTWSSTWYPDPATKCNGVAFTQYNDCVAGAVDQRSTTAYGTGADNVYTYPGQPPSAVCPDQQVARRRSCDGYIDYVPGTSTATACSATCPEETKSWGAGNACSGTLMVTSNNTTVVLPTTSSNTSGDATFYCTAGAWQPQGTPTCNVGCGPSVINWAGTVSGCTSPELTDPMYAHNFSTTVNDGATTVQGSVTVTCNNGTWLQSSPSCNTVSTTGGGGGGGGGCFVAGTMVTMWDGSRRAIETILAGEMIRTYNEKTGQIESSPVAAYLHHRIDETSGYLFTFKTEDGREFTANDIHPIYLVEDGSYVRVAKLHKRWEAGEAITLFGQDKSPVRVTEIKKFYKPTPVYNLHVLGPYDQGMHEVDVGHNYFVEGIMVHNARSTKEVTGEAESSR